MENFNEKTEQLMLLDVNVGEDKNYTELIVVDKNITELEVWNAIREYLDTDEWKERSIDDEITEYLIRIGMAKDYMTYRYVDVS